MIWLSLACNGPVFSQSVICAMPSDTESARSWAPLATWFPATVSKVTTTAMTSTTISPAAAPRGIPLRSIQLTTGSTRAAMNIAMTTGSTITIRNPTTQAITYAAAAMTRNRHAHAAARSTPQGTCAREKLEVPAVTGTGTGVVRRSLLRIAERCCHWWAMRSVSRSPEPSSPASGEGSTDASERVSSAPLPTRTG